MLCYVFSTLDHSKRVLYIYTKMFLNGQLDQHLPFNYFKLKSFYNLVCNMFAKPTAIFVPMAVRWVCR